ncbi:MAG: GDSL-type esterase/lipase family protein [Planctomycetota bacterium]
MASKRAPLLIAIIAVALGLPLLASVLLLLANSPEASLSLTLGLLVLSALLLAGVTRRRGEALVASGAIVAFLIVWPEVGLRVAGWRFDAAGVVQFGYPRPDSRLPLERDPELFWRLASGSEGTNSLGFLGPEIEVRKPRETFRLLFLGDSCTAQGYPKRGYVNIVLELLNGFAGASRRFEAVNLSLFGYSSHQGVVLARKWAPQLAPDLGVVYYGWNDHWQAYGGSDREKAASTAPRLLLRKLGSSRLVRWLARRAAAVLSRPLDKPRVSLEEYRENLAHIGECIGKGGGRVVLLTAPSAHERLGVPDYLVEQGFAASKEQVLELHRRYNDVVREVAREQGWFLLDLDADSAAVDDPASIFLADGIHFTPRGLQWVATCLAELVVKQVLKPP